jgi:hypothetical protein
MTLKNGKFYDQAGNVVPLEFGNKEQIETLQRAEAWMREGEYLEEDYVLSSDGERIVAAIYSWTCLCGKYVTAKQHERMAGRKYKCSDCSNRFEVIEDEDQDLFTRLLPKK